jgi:excisionase family DNA binding protein
MDLTSKNVLTFDEAVEYTGFKKSYLYKLTALDVVPVYRPQGKKLFFRREELEKFLTEDKHIVEAVQKRKKP